jgi:hypothetical protein
MRGSVNPTQTQNLTHRNSLVDGDQEPPAERVMAHPSSGPFDTRRPAPGETDAGGQWLKYSPRLRGNDSRTHVFTSTISQVHTGALLGTVSRIARHHGLTPVSSSPFLVCPFRFCDPSMVTVIYQFPMSRPATKPLGLAGALVLTIILISHTAANSAGAERTDSATSVTEEDLDLIRFAAKRGDVESAYLLGQQYSAGEGVPQNTAALPWVIHARLAMTIPKQ